VAELAGLGVEVVATARRVEDLADLPAATRLPLDATSDSSVAAVSTPACRVDLVVNNAAVSRRRSRRQACGDLQIRWRPPSRTRSPATVGCGYRSGRTRRGCWPDARLDDTALIARVREFGPPGRTGGGRS
jgi:hypothetical protein